MPAGAGGGAGAAGSRGRRSEGEGASGRSEPQVTVRMSVNGRAVTRTVPARLTLADFIREELELTGTHLGCEHGVCGACNVLVDGLSMRSCILYAGQMEGAEITTIEGLSPPDGSLTPIQPALHVPHRLQCGFCPPRFLPTLHHLLAHHPPPPA